MNRRHFLECLAAAASLPAGNAFGRATNTPLRPDPGRLLDLPEGFEYSVVSTIGEIMSDGLPVPGAHDGMAAFAGNNGQIVLIRNHEISPAAEWAGPYVDAVLDLPANIRDKFYDPGGGKTPGLGGTTTTIYDPQTRTAVRQFLSLAGTEINCAGGITPWGSWLSCEESFGAPGVTENNAGAAVVREKRHGYVFEVPASARAPVDPVPLKDMGRFEHEAAAVHEKSGIVYQTEDRWQSLFYRFIPNVRGRLERGGKLQALAVKDNESGKTHNWDSDDMRLNERRAVTWVDLEDVDNDDNDLRKRGAAAGATTFARGEGLTAAGDMFAFTCTIGGPARLGQVFAYEPSPFEGSEKEADSPGHLVLLAEAEQQGLLKHCDNLTMAPWGDLVVCEDSVDGKDECSLVGIKPDGREYFIANNAYSDSELAGACFSPDGKTLFLNIQYPGMTVAITGPWGSLTQV